MYNVTSQITNFHHVFSTLSEAIECVKKNQSLDEATGLIYPIFYSISHAGRQIWGIHQSFESIEE